MSKFFASALLLLGFLEDISAGDKRESNGEAFVLEINPFEGKITLDGLIDEGVWNKAEKTSAFINKWPIDSGLAQAKTDIWILYDENFIYIAAKCYQKQEDLVIQSLKRDNMGSHWNSDGIAIALDPINQKSNGYLFGVNAGGAQIEATLTSQGNRTNWDSNWDNKWYSSVKQYPDYWVAEMAIPFKTLRYSENNDRWGINIQRNDQKNNVFSTWAQVPLGFRGVDLGYMGTLQWDNPPRKTKGNVVLVPYIAGGRSKDYEPDDDGIVSSAETTKNIGLDAKIAVTSSLNLDLTLNPDFSNVDVDRQVTNVSRFNINFPEKRNFFLENSDLFSEFGEGDVRPFFSRQIGIHEGEQVPILFGARLSGNLTDDVRIGIMDVHTRSTEELNATNYLIGTVQKRVLERSTVKVLFNNKQDFPTTDTVLGSYNRTAGAEFNYTSVNGMTSGNVAAHWATTDERLSDFGYYSAEFGRNGKNFRWRVRGNRVEENYLAEMGFIRRLSHNDALLDTTIRVGYQSVNPWVSYTWSGSEGDNFRQQRVWSWNQFVYSIKDGSFMERRSVVNYERLLRNNLRIRVGFVNQSVVLQVPAAPIGFDEEKGEEPLPVGRYGYTFLRTRIQTDSRKVFQSETQINYGSFYNGTRLEISEEMRLRLQPWGVISISYNYNNIVLADGYGEKELHLVGPKAEISLKSNLWWTSFLQFNTQDENFNISSRIQWRYKPMSDLFIVYSDNYVTDGSFDPTGYNRKNRGLVFKLTYWFNL